jgi:hypothetical protein
VNEFHNGWDETRQIGKDNRKEENVAWFSVEIAMTENGECQGHVDRYCDRTGNEFCDCKEGVIDFDGIVHFSVDSEKKNFVIGNAAVHFFQKL